MKILQITNKVPVPPKDGGSIASIRLAEGLAILGHKVQMLAMNTSKHFVEPDIIRNFEKPNLAIMAVPVDTGIHPHKALYNLLFSKMPYNAVRFISSDFRKALTDLLKNINPDLIILENLYPAAYLKDIRELTNAQVVYRAHNVEYEIWRRTADKTKGLRKWYLGILANRIKKFETDLINRYDFLVPITKRDARALDEMGNTKPSFVLPTGYIGEHTNYPTIVFNKQAVAHLGALDWMPNQEGLIWFVDKVWPLLRKEIPELEFHLAGRNAPKWFEKRIIGTGIIYHGEIEDAENFLQTFPIHIVPLFSGSGMRIKIVEAMANGRVVVTTTIGTEGIDTQDKINILVADTPSSFSSTIVEAISDPVYCQEIGKNAFTFVVDKLNNEKLVTGFMQFLNSNI